MKKKLLCQEIIVWTEFIVAKDNYLGKKLLYQFCLLCNGLFEYIHRHRDRIITQKNKEEPEINKYLDISQVGYGCWQLMGYVTKHINVVFVLLYHSAAICQPSPYVYEHEVSEGTGN